MPESRKLLVCFKNPRAPLGCHTLGSAKGGRSRAANSGGSLESGHPSGGRLMPSPAPGVCPEPAPGTVGLPWAEGLPSSCLAACVCRSGPPGLRTPAPCPDPDPPRIWPCQSSAGWSRPSASRSPIQGFRAAAAAPPAERRGHLSGATLAALDRDRADPGHCVGGLAPAQKYRLEGGCSPQHLSHKALQI